MFLRAFIIVNVLCVRAVRTARDSIKIKITTTIAAAAAATAAAVPTAANPLDSKSPKNNI